MSLEGHFCYEYCDEGPHGCICGNDCDPPDVWMRGNHLRHRVKTETGSVYEFFEGKVRRVGRHDLRRDGEWLNILAMKPWKIGEPLVMKLEPLGECQYPIRTASRITAYTIRTTSRITAIE